MESSKLVMLFPGQGACYSGVLRQSAHAYPQVRNVIEEIDALSRERFGRSVSELIWQPAAPSTDAMLREAPEIFQLSIYTVSICAFKMLRSEGVEPDAVMGHSFGEIAALVSSGAFTVIEGARIVCERAEATRSALGLGYMAALSADAETTEKLVSLVGNHQVTIAAENARAQTVVSGIRDKVDRIAQLAKILNIGFVPLNSLYPFHSPLMEPAKETFRQRIAGFNAKPMSIPVFSPILLRYYAESDQLTQCLADHLVRPVRFAPAVEQLHADGVRTFVEAGALDALTKLAQKTLPDQKIRTIAMLNRPSDELASIRQSIGQLLPPSASASATSYAPRLGGGIPLEDAGDFWKEHEVAVEQFVRESYALFRAKTLSRKTTGAAGPSPTDPALATAVPKCEPGAVLRDLIAMYAEAMEYPEEVFTETVELEAELGIDSVKQTELLARASQKYGLPPAPPNFRLSSYGTLGKVADFIASAMPAGSSGQSSKTASRPFPATAGRTSRGELLREIVTMYAEALEYPEEVFTESVELEAELGIDSVKQTEMLGRLSEKYDLPPRPADFRLSNYSTLGKVVDFVQAALVNTDFAVPVGAEARVDQSPTLPGAA